MSVLLFTFAQRYQQKYFTDRFGPLLIGNVHFISTYLVTKFWLLPIHYWFVHNNFATHFPLNVGGLYSFAGHYFGLRIGGTRMNRGISTASPNFPL